MEFRERRKKLRELTKKQKEQEKEGRVSQEVLDEIKQAQQPVVSLSKF
jgi:hypothetical protein